MDADASSAGGPEAGGESTRNTVGGQEAQTLPEREQRVADEGGQALQGRCVAGQPPEWAFPAGRPREAGAPGSRCPRGPREKQTARFPPATGRGRSLGPGAREGLWSSHAYLTYCPFQIDFNEALSAPHFLELKQFPPGILLKLLFNLKGR